MKNIQLLKTILVLSLIVSWVFPEYGRDLFESKSHIEKFTVILFIAGIYLDWKYIEDFVLGFYSISLLFVVIAGLFFSSYTIYEKPGFVLHSVIFILIILPTFQLMRLKRRKISQQITKV